MKLSLHKRKNDYFVDQNKIKQNTASPEPSKKKEFSTQKISRTKRGDIVSDAGPKEKITPAHKTGSYYHRLRKNKVEIEEGHNEYNQAFDNFSPSKEKDSRISRSSILPEERQSRALNNMSHPFAAPSKIQRYFYPFTPIANILKIYQ